MRLASLRRFSAQERRDHRYRLREQSLEAVIALMERLIYDIARLCAGHSVVMDEYVAPPLQQRLRETLRPFLQDDCVLLPDFGAHAEMRVEGDLVQAGQPVFATVEIDDASRIEAANGLVHALPSRRIVLRATISIDAGAIEDVSIALRPPAAA
ncbi:MAG TPA: hypothetical protein VJU79_03840 [Candidatus Dormibacteraeota bacterium]|nr:hypothetical protein [Candidatus Dormibacteraeota bacterium]